MDKTKILDAYNKWLTIHHRLPSLEEINTPENRLPTEKDIADSLGLSLNEYLEIYHPIYYKYGEIPQEPYNASYNKNICEMCQRYLMDKEHTGYITATKDYKLPQKYGTWAVTNFGLANTMATLAGINDNSFVSKYFVTSKTHRWLRWVSRFCTAKTFFDNVRINDTFNSLCGQVRKIFEQTGMYNFCDCLPKNNISFSGSVLVLNPFEIPENKWALNNQLLFSIYATMDKQVKCVSMDGNETISRFDIQQFLGQCKSALPEELQLIKKELTEKYIKEPENKYDIGMY